MSNYYLSPYGITYVYIQMLKNIIYKIVIILIRLLRIFPFEKNQILICTPASAGSLGDQALLQGAIDGIHEKYGSTQYTIIQVIQKDWTPIKTINIDLHITIKDTYYGELIRFIPKLYKTKHFGIIGADIMDGKYSTDLVQNLLKLCNEVDKLNIPTTIFGFSYSTNTDNKSVNTFTKLNDNTNI